MIRHALLSALALSCCTGLSSAQTGRSLLLTTAATVGGSLNVQINFPPGQQDNLFALYWSPKFGGAINLGIPAIQGLLLLNPAQLGLILTGSFNITGTVNINLPIPNNPAFVGGAFDIQSVDISWTTLLAYLSDNDVTPYIRGCFGTVLQATGTVASLTTGDFRFQKVNRTLTAATQAVPSTACTFQAIRHYGQNAGVEGYAGTFTNTTGNSDINSLRRDRVSRKLLSTVHASLVLPNGFDIVFLRDKATPRNNYIVSIRQSDGTSTLLATYVDSAAALTLPTNGLSAFQPQVAATDNGDLIAVIVRDSTNSAGGGAAANLDKVWLIKTGGATWTNGLAAPNQRALNVTATATIPTQYVDGTLVLCGNLAAGGRVFVQGNNGRWYTTNFTDSASNKLLVQPIMNTGTGKANAFLFTQARHRSPDNKTLIVPIGGDATGSQKENDLYAFTDITSASFNIKNLTGFFVPTQIQQLGLSSITQTSTTPAFSSNGLKGAFSPDGTKYAFLTGNDNLPLAATPPYVNQPARLFVCKTDGSSAGGLISSPTDYMFDPQVNYMSDLAFVGNETVVFFAGKYTVTGGTVTEVALDAYALNLTTTVITNLTKTCTGSKVPPFTAGGNCGNIRPRSCWKSTNGNWYYFIRGYGPQVTTQFANNIVAISAFPLVKDITGSEFSGGTCPSIYRAVSTTSTGYTTDPWAALEFNLRRAPVGNMAFFAAENAAGASTTVFNDSNVFGFDIENGGQATQLTPYNGTGTQLQVKTISQLTVAPDGTYVAWAQRLGTSTAPEDVFTVKATGGPVFQMSNSARFLPAVQSVSDGSLVWTCKSGNAWTLAWIVGTGSVLTPSANCVGQANISDGNQGPPLDITSPPLATPAKVLLMLNGNGTL